MGARKYNHIYQLLVQGDDDLIGQVAYALYKKEKHAWVQRFKEEERHEPEDEDLAKFHCFVCSDENKNRFRLQAQSIVQQMMSAATERTINQAQEELNRNHQAQLRSVVKPLITSFWMAVLQGVVASFIFSLLIVAFVSIARWGGLNFSAFFDWLR